jgi:hypothetical protein
MAMRLSTQLFFVFLTVGGSIYLLVTDRGERRYAIGALVASSIGLLLQLNVITLHLHYARTVVWAAIAVCAAFLWLRDSSKTGATVAACMFFASSLTVARAFGLLR